MPDSDDTRLLQSFCASRDWQRWQAKTPAPLRDRVNALARDALKTDAALLAVLWENR